MSIRSPDISPPRFRTSTLAGSADLQVLATSSTERPPLLTSRRGTITGQSSEFWAARVSAAMTACPPGGHGLPMHGHLPYRSRAAVANVALPAFDDACRRDIRRRLRIPPTSARSRRREADHGRARWRGSGRVRRVSADPSRGSLLARVDTASVPPSGTARQAAFEDGWWRRSSGGSGRYQCSILSATHVGAIWGLARPIDHGEVATGLCLSVWISAQSVWLGHHGRLA
jgi:hypothetical protein